MIIDQIREILKNVDFLLNLFLESEREARAAFLRSKEAADREAELAGSFTPSSEEHNTHKKHSDEYARLSSWWLDQLGWWAQMVQELRVYKTRLVEMLEGREQAIGGCHGLEEPTSHRAVRTRAARGDGWLGDRVEGRIAGLQEGVLYFGSKRYGAPDDNTMATILAIRDIEQLTDLMHRLLDVGNHDWRDVLPQGR
jgi:hypothetical protein